MKFYERVISDFGGYEKCKDILSQPNIDFIMNAQGLREHMLEYRRQHNIFEVGDKVVHLFYKGSDVQELKGVNGLKLTLYHHNMGYHYIAYAPDFRHATDEEIAAGRRL